MTHDRVTAVEGLVECGDDPVLSRGHGVEATLRLREAARRHREVSVGAARDVEHGAKVVCPACPQ
jgi:hypothetical protein